MKLPPSSSKSKVVPPNSSPTPTPKSTLIEQYHHTANASPDSHTFPPLTRLAADQAVEVLKISLDHHKYSDFSNQIPYIYQSSP